MLRHQIVSITSWLLVALTYLCATEAALSPPACQSVAPNETRLNDVRTARLNVSGRPFGVVFASPRSPNRAFAAVNDSLVVLNTSELTPRLLHSIPLRPGLAGVALTHGGGHVLVAAGRGVVVVSAARALQGSANAVVGILDGPISAGNSAISLTLSNDDKYVFVGQEYGLNTSRGAIAVFKLQHPAANGTISGSYVGDVALGKAVAGLALSPDGRILYATSEIAYTNTTQRHGTLSVIDVEKLKTDPSTALLYTFDAGCNPVRVIASRDGKTVWVTARESNRLLAFDAAKLLSNSSVPLVASVQVGTSPVDLIFARNETRILTADSNRFNAANTTTGLSVVDVDAALSGKEAALGQIPTGKFPREFAISHDGRTILVSDFGSNQIQAVDVATLP